MENNFCVACGGPVALGRAVDVISIAGRKTSVEVEGYRCASCGEVYFTPDQADTAQRLAASVLRKKEGLLAPEDIRAIRKRLGLTQADLERLLGVGPKTVVRWERGTVFQSSSVDRLLRVVAELPEAARILTRHHTVMPS